MKNPLKKAAENLHRVGISQGEFAKLLSVSFCKLHGWEHGRRVPTGAAQTLLHVDEKHPEALADLF
ncbi:helix-turn-helix domain-containing protein [Halomonas sp. AOP13-D3-9]